MGLIRKTASVATLGIIPFRSKKEKLRRAEKAHREAQVDLAGEQAARAEADKRLVAAEKRARQAELQALQQAKRADVARGKRKERRRKARSEARAAIEDLVGSATPVVEERAKDLGRRGRKAAAKAAKRAEAAAEEARKQAKKQGRRARKKMVDLTEAASPKIESLRGDAVALGNEAIIRGSELAGQARAKASERAERR